MISKCASPASSNLRKSTVRVFCLPLALALAAVMGGDSAKAMEVSLSFEPGHLRRVEHRQGSARASSQAGDGLRAREKADASGCASHRGHTPRADECRGLSQPGQRRGLRWGGNTRDWRLHHRPALATRSRRSLVQPRHDLHSS
jgi:hypothetical protein